LRIAFVLALMPPPEESPAFRSVITGSARAQFVYRSSDLA
jgi:hypothetical protein